MNNSKAMWVPESRWGVCLWELPTDHSSGGGYIASGPGEFLCMEGPVNSPSVEALMREAAIHYLGEDIGKPHWIPGSRKVTSNERDDQMERLLDGKIPDWEEEWKLALKDGNVK